jgi:hypothetical protein
LVSERKRTFDQLFRSLQNSRGAVNAVLGFTLKETKQLLELRLAHGKDVEREEHAAQSGVEQK